jgi:multimeric flavodoxin WrbA
MKAIIINGFDQPPQAEAERLILDALGSLLAERNCPLERFDTAAMAIHPCSGCFDCWLKTPGRCAVRDDQESIVAGLAACELRILLTPVTFGGYGFHLKKAMDRSIPVLLPFFRHFHGEVHHPQRYPGRKKLLAVGSDGRGDAAMNETFARITRRNALNMQIDEWRALTIPLALSPEAIRQNLRQALDQLEVNP